MCYPYTIPAHDHSGQNIIGPITGKQRISYPISHYLLSTHSLLGPGVLRKCWGYSNARQTQPVPLAHSGLKEAWTPEIQPPPAHPRRATAPYCLLSSSFLTNSYSSYGVGVGESLNLVCIMHFYIMKCF